MKVRANAAGFYGQLRGIGDEFEVREGSTATWFEPVKSKKRDLTSDSGKPGEGEAA